MKYMLALAAVLSNVTADVDILRSDLDYESFTFDDRETAVARALHLSPIVTYQYFDEEDFGSRGSLQQDDNSDLDLFDYGAFENGAKTLDVHPCQSVVIQINMDTDFANDWLVTQDYGINLGLQNVAFVEAYEDDSESSSVDVEYEAIYIVKVPCDATPGQTYNFDEQDSDDWDQDEEGRAGMWIYYDYNELNENFD